MAHILLVEDNEANAEVAIAVCVAAGHTVRWSRNGLEALRRLLAKERFDLVLLDVLMPEMDGLDLAQALRESSSHARLPIIAVTAVSGRRDAEKLHAAGVDLIVTKPYRREDLLQAIAATLGGGRD